jgi:hypothetical protein
MESSTGNLVLWGVTNAARSFRPGDWAERLAGLTSAFGPDQKLMYSPLVCPVNVRGVKAVIVGRALEALEPRLFQFFRNFAHDNDLRIDYVDDALRAPELLTEPHARMRAEPQEPV